MARSFASLRAQARTRMPISSLGSVPVASKVGGHVLAARAARLINARKQRSNYFPEDLFADPAWDILLDLTLAALQQQRVTVSSLCIGANVPQTTALRWIKHMTNQGLLKSEEDRLDGRRRFIELTPGTFAKMVSYLEELGEQDMRVV